MGRIIGIDLGTTNTAVAVITDGRPRVIEDERGYKVLPSVVSSRGEGRFIVGQAAHDLILTSPDRTVYASKRLMGRRFDSPEVQKAMQRLQYQLSEAADGGVLIKVGDEWMTPPEVAAIVLQVARTMTEKALGEPVESAIITVPAHFNNAQRAQTLEAAELAGLRCDRLLNEPTAAALAYGHRKNVDRTVVLFDLGGGTFDVTVLKLADGVYEVLATSGDTWLGGEDFDYRVVDHLADAFQARTGSDLRTDRNALQRLKDAAERAKCDLSFSDRTNIVVPHLFGGKNLETLLTRTTLESLTADLITRCIDITRGAVADAGLPLSEVDEVVLVGGQTRMPRVREAVSGLFGREPSRSVHPEEAVAVGAAIYGNSLADSSQPQPILLDVTPFDLGIDSSGGMFSTIIAKNARVPTSETRSFTTAFDKQTSVRITVRQGESRVSVENEFLGEFVLEGLAPAARMQTKVDVTFRLDSNGILHVSAVDRAGGEPRAIAIRNYAERAREPQMPSAEQAARDVADRQQRPVAAPVPVSAETVKKAGFLASIFGSKSVDKPVVKPSVTAAVPAAGPASPAAALEESVPSVMAIPVVEPVPSIDMAALGQAPIPVDAELIDDLDSDAALAAIVDEEAIYGREPAKLAVGAPTPEPVAGPEPLDAADLFDSEDLAGDPDSDIGVDGVGEHTIDEDELAADMFGSDVDVSALFGEGTGPGGLTFEGMLEAEGALQDAVVVGEEPAAGVPNPFDDTPTAGGVVEPAAEAPAVEAAAELAPAAAAEAEPAPRRKRPAKLKLHYHERESFLVEYRDNLRRNGAFIKTEKPLAVGRECEFEVDAPGLAEPLVFAGVVSYVSDGLNGEQAGMGVEYRMDESTRALLSVLVGR